MSQPQPHAILIRLAHALLGKAARSEGDRVTTLRLDDDRILPELMRASSPDELAHLALLIDELCETTWVRLQMRKAQPFQTWADRQPTLVLLNGPTLAEWSGFAPTPPRWSRLLVEALRAPGVLEVPDATCLLHYLLRNPLPWFEHRSANECARALNELARACAAGQRLYLRELSALHFRGHSKVLDAREELLKLLGAAPNQFMEAPVQTLIDLPLSARAETGWFNEVIFIENLVSFERMAQMRQPAWNQAALVFASGFKGTAKRLRQRDGSSLYWRGSVSAAQREVFELWLYEGLSNPAAIHDAGSAFFGDLDFAGLLILAQLRHIFPDCQAWIPGYQGLLDQLIAGHGHSPNEANKQGQIDPGHTGCHFTDNILLPALRSTNACVDQELWSGFCFNRDLYMSNVV
ncbi:hypothetical protein [Aquabacterium sp.]|uniref:hypothetical protein n=1 Tax=Aquabacterium sp. TaxID=1872578 RepID=UPI002486EBDE|nr:hypothetical protein [Aquabacterium sp.]MDI1259215.1 hypothetical protein [Aquabacterium sp.]